MNKPEQPEIFDRTKSLFKRAADAGGQALKDVRDAGHGVVDKLTRAEDESKRRRNVLILAGLVALAVLAVIFVVSRLGGEGAARQDVDVRQAVTSIVVEPRAFSSVVSLNGEARPKRDIQVSAPATGVRILEILVDEGDTVRAGQPMARLDTALSGAMTRAAEASVAEARSASVRARGEYQRAESIRDSGALSTEAIELRRAAALAADARLAAAQAQLAESNARLGGGYVRAPAAGLVIGRSAEVGRSVDGQILFRLAADNELEIAAEVAESDMLALSDGQSATFQLVDGSTVQARLTRLPASIDSRTRTGEALFALPRNSRVRAGMFLRGEATLPERTLLAVPQSSVLYEGGAAYVFVIQGEQGRVARTPVELGVRNGDFVEIKTGLNANDRIVGSGAAFLRDGDVVRALPEQAPAQAREGDNLRGRDAASGQSGE